MRWDTFFCEDCLLACLVFGFAKCSGSLHLFKRKPPPICGSLHLFYLSQSEINSAMLILILSGTVCLPWGGSSSFQVELCLCQLFNVILLLMLSLFSRNLSSSTCGMRHTHFLTWIFSHPGSRQRNHPSYWWTLFIVAQWQNCSWGYMQAGCACQGSKHDEV